MSPAFDPPRLNATTVAALRVFFVALCLAIVTAPALNMVVPLFAQAPLVGAVAKLSRPAATLASLFDESYQRALTAYFEREYGARPLATRFDNSLDYWVFGEAPPGARVRVGARDTLYLDEQLTYLNRRDTPDAAAIAAKIARAQRLLRAQGKALILLLEPTKATVWPDDVPTAWRVDGASADGVRARIADPYVAALRSADVAFVDGRSAVAHLPREAVYTKTGRHVSPPASCEILGAALELARPIVRDAEIPTADCRYEMRAGGALDEDFDLFLLLNVWAPHPSNAVPIMAPASEAIPRERRASAMVVGSSFGWNLVYQAERMHAFRQLYFHYYSTTLEDRGGAPPRPLPLRSREWQDVIASTTLFLYPIPEEFLIQDAEPFVDAVIAIYRGGTVNGLRSERSSRVLAASGIVAVVLAFVYATQRGITKAPLLETGAWGALVLLAFAGWGGVVDRLLFPDRRADFGLRAVWGASVVLFIGGLLAMASLFSRTADVLLVDVGLVAFAALLYVERRQNAAGVLFAARVVRRNGLLAVLVAVVLLAALTCYMGAVADGTTNAYDDDIAYLAFVRKLVETGTLIEPFSFRRMSAFGGQTVFQSLLIPHAGYQQLNTFDRGICVLVIVALILGHREGRRRLPLALTALVLGFFLTLPNNSINTAPHFAGFAFFLGMFRTMVFLREDDRVPSKAIVLALVAIATCTLRQNYLSVPVLTLGASYAYRVLGKRGGETLRERLREPLMVCAVSAVLLLPWLVLAYRSNQSILFPLQNGTFRKALALQSPTLSFIDELGLLVSMTLENEPIKVLGILALAGALVRDDHPYKPLRAFWISSALSFMILWRSFTLSTHGNLSRYVFGFVAALAAAVFLSAGTRRLAGRGSAHARAVVALAVGAILVQYTTSRANAAKTYQTYLDSVERERRRPPTSIDTLPHEVFMYGHVQSFVPAGERMAAMVDATYLLDYARNPIFNIDMPGFSSLKPDMPFFEGSEKVAEYFLAHGIRYVVYVRPEFSQSLYQRNFWFKRIYNEEELWRLFSPYMVNLIDTFTQLRETRVNLHEEAGIVVLDLATRR